MSERNPRIIVVGSSNTDMVVKTDRLPAPGETVLGGEFVMVPGGKGANQAVAAAKLGAEVELVARVGCDMFGDASLENFGLVGVGTRFIVRDPDHPSGVALIFVDRGGENVIVVASGANAFLSPADVDPAAETLASADTLVLQLEIPLETVEHATRLARCGGARVVLNPAPARPGGLPKGLLSAVDVLVPNESEARMLLGLTAGESVSDPAAGVRLLDLGVGCAVVTLGARGALVVTRDEARVVPAPKTTAVDTTAAGDAFTGALAVALSSGRDMFESAEFANSAAAISVTRMGAQPSMPTLDEMTSFVSG